ncbi:hypothetical protein BH24DEI2_BH24DEI2_11060 [soil metagenome]
MNKTATLPPALVEACALLSLVALIAAFGLVVASGTNTLGMIFLGLGLVTNIAVAFCYGLFVIRYEPPLGKRLATLFNNDSSRIVRYIVNSFVG